MRRLFYIVLAEKPCFSRCRTKTIPSLENKADKAIPNIGVERLSRLNSIEKGLDLTNVSFIDRSFMLSG